MGGRIRRALPASTRNQLWLTGLFLALLALFMMTGARAFLAWPMYESLLSTLPLYGFLALGLTLVVAAGEMDLCFPSTLAVAGFGFALTAIHTGQVWRGAVMLLSQGLALGLADLGGSPTHTVLAGRLGGFLPMQSFWLIVMALALWLLLNRHPLGDAIRFTGEQADIASRLGINVPAARLGVHTLMGGIAGFAGAIGCMEMGSWWPTQGDGYMLLVFAAVFIGGTSVFGGSGRLYGTLIGIAIVGMIEAGIVSSGLSGFWTRAVHGMVIVVAVSSYAILSGNADERILRLVRWRKR